MRATKHTTPLRRSVAHPIISFGLITLAIICLIIIVLVQNSTPTASAKGASLWQRAQGVNGNFLSVAFAKSDLSIGYASIILSKQAVDIYATGDEGTHWKKVATINAPMLDLLSIDPLNAHDLVVLSSYAPASGTYSIYRSMNGGTTWQRQTAPLQTAATVSQIGWSGNEALIGFARDTWPAAGSAIVTFSPGHDGIHLDQDGALSTTKIDTIQYLHGDGNTITITGMSHPDQHGATSLISLRSTNHGSTWSDFTYEQGGRTIAPLAASATGETVIGVTPERDQIYLSHDAGASWELQHDYTGHAIDLASNAPVVGTDGTYFVKLIGDISPGLYSLQNSHASTYRDTHDVITLSYDSGGHVHRLWAYESGQLIWRAA
jgi:photosystem II stability/assembly factor-like uncharacterized protein